MNRKHQLKALRQGIRKGKRAKLTSAAEQACHSKCADVAEQFREDKDVKIHNAVVLEYIDSMSRETMNTILQQTPGLFMALTEHFGVRKILREHLFDQMTIPPACEAEHLRAIKQFTAEVTSSSDASLKSAIDNVQQAYESNHRHEQAMVQQCIMLMNANIPMTVSTTHCSWRNPQRSWSANVVKVQRRFFVLEPTQATIDSMSAVQIKCSFPQTIQFRKKEIYSSDADRFAMRFVMKKIANGWRPKNLNATCMHPDIFHAMCQVLRPTFSDNIISVVLSYF